MTIARLRQISRLPLPVDVSDDDEVDELRVLMAAGLIAALYIKVPQAPLGTGDDACCRPVASRMVRILAITSDGRRLLERVDPPGAREDGKGATGRPIAR